MKVVVVDAGNLSGEPYFPSLNLPKYGWVEYPSQTQEEAAENCWRTDVIITVKMPIDKAILDKAIKLRVVVIMNEDGGLVDREAVDARGIQVIQVAGFDTSDPEQALKACRRVMTRLNALIREGELG
ncbi:MAG: hypothetical protein GY934_23275 [Gammaproteobacteria bacterium]|nr:hypothetical protein [Gammaproteobacteria bacterium]